MTLHNGRPFTMSVEFLSDWSVGTGEGRHGGVDAVVRRDTDGLPCLGGKAAVNLLRDRAELVARALGADWTPWVSILFGSQPAVTGGSHLLPSALTTPPLRLPEAVRRAVLSQQVDGRPLRDGLVLVRSGVALDEHRAAKVDQLRFHEVARAGLVLEAQWILRLPGVDEDAPVPAEAELVLLSAVQLWERAGGGRRRGLGRCRATLRPQGSTTDLAALVDDEELLRTPSAPPSAAVRAKPAAPEVLQGHDDVSPVHRYDLVITVELPVVAAATTRDNLVTTHDYLPGSLLLPLVLRALGPTAAALLSGGLLRVGDATVEVAGRRGLPAPRSVQREKRADVGDVVVVTHPDADLTRRLAPVSGFCAVDEGQLVLARPGLVLQTHGSVDDEQQRPVGPGGIFVYQGIAPGTVLRSEVHLPPDTLVDVSLLAGTHRVGRSAKDDYGQVTIEVREPARHPRTAEPIPAGSPVTVWLTAGAVLLDEALEPTTTLDALRAAMSGALGVELADAPDDATGSAFLSVARRESWQRSWGLPRPTVTAIAAGSVATFTASSDVGADAVDMVQRRGVGHRRAEGYGEVIINADLFQRPAWTQHDVRSRPPATITSDRAPADVDTRWADALWVEAIRRHAQGLALDPERRSRLVPPGASRAQLGSLRTAVSGSAATASLAAWCTAVRRNPARARVWDSTLRALATLADSPDELWRQLELEPPPRTQRARLGDLGISVTLDEALRQAAASAQGDQS